ncbi:MAG: hypothetical protein ABEN55_14545, partial [Bradymonadaceae bacterium]
EDVAVQWPAGGLEDLRLAASEQLAEVESQVLALSPLLAVDEEQVGARHEQHPTGRVVELEQLPVEEVAPGRRVVEVGRAVVVGGEIRVLGRKDFLVEEIDVFTVRQRRIDDPEPRIAVAGVR